MPVVGTSPSTPRHRNTHSASSAGGTTSSSSSTGTSADPAPTPPPTDTFESTSTTSQRKIAERALARAGHKPGAVDGNLTAATRKSLKAFQGAVGLEKTGVLDEQTYKELKGLSSRLQKNGKKVLEAGMKSAKVEEVEKRLRRLGYDVGAADGLYTQKTAEAVQAFRKDQKNLEGTTGRIGVHGQKVLAKETRALNHAPWRRRVKNTKAHKIADRRATRAAAKKHADGTTGLGLGSKSTAVATIKQHLRAAGYDPKTTSNAFDARTEGMVRELQKRADLPVTGRVDERTWKHLRKAKMEASSATSPSQRKGERSGAVKRTEKLLKKMGFNPGAVDGLYDAKTQRAVDRFRRAFRAGGKKGMGVGQSTLNAIKRAAKTPRVTAGDLVAIMPGLTRDRAEKMVPHLHQAMAEFGIHTRKRQAAFLAQLGHESVGLRYFEEIASGAAYEGRADLGNTQPGDGVRYKGRGPIQLTGRSNYRRAGQALGLPLEARPKMAARTSVGFRTAGWFWKTNGLNELADRGRFDDISVRINGGYNGFYERREYHARAKRVLFN